MDKYELKERLGVGSFGVVYRAINRVNDEIVAIKIIDLEQTDEDILHIQQEIQHLAACQSDYVTKYYASFMDGFKLWIGSCLDVVRSYTHFYPPPHASQIKKKVEIRQEQVATICRELLKGLEYLHSEGKIHRDIKAANVLLSETGQVKLADFGVAAQICERMSKRNTFVGTPFWMAPEVIQQTGYDTRADIWSLGITAIELATGLPPLSDFHPLRVLFLIPKSAPPELEGEHFSDSFKDFVKECLTKDFHNRPSATELLEHPFVATAHDTNILHTLIDTLSDGVVSTKNSPNADNESDEDVNSLIDEWNWSFGTLRASGTLTGTRKASQSTRNDISQTDMARKYAALGADASNGRKMSSSSILSRKQSSDASSGVERTWIHPPTPTQDQHQDELDHHLEHLEALINKTSDPREIASLMVLKNSYRDLHDRNRALYNDSRRIYQDKDQGVVQPLPYKTNEISEMLFDRWTEAITQKGLLIAYSSYYDKLAIRDGGPTYTDVDYRVVSDAAELVHAGKSPYERATYRYTPLLSWLMLPNAVLDDNFGKVLFSLADVGIAYSIARIQKKLGRRSTWLTHLLCIFNPVVISISTRGSPESIVGLLVMTTLDTLLHEHYTLAAVFMALSVHYKIYPFIYASSVLAHLWHKKRRLAPLAIFSAISLTVFAVINLLMYRIYGMDFVHSTYLYHVGRKDHRHNFAPYFYPVYLGYDSVADLVSNPAFSLLPQLALSFGLGVVYGGADLPLAWFMQTFAFVTFNRVCTSQYFLWYMWLLPLVIPSFKLTSKQKIYLPLLWVVAQGIWLALAYRLEFLGQPLFIPLWIASLVWFSSNAYILATLIGSCSSVVTQQKQRIS
ncbi:hypothetical protein E3P99_02215 [Wallemia hederae]|uniref:non-specific serine/threonine protein kinase n=1 Tax=Wallemia hederae TaxID=1540922 RepID=A0A4V4LTV3_9BASI|nr:hypothetical protein E3P99_02215 [Wallemia hederae]